MPDADFEPADQIRSSPDTALRVLRDPQVFFAELPRDGGYEQPAFFAGSMLVAYGAILAVLSLIGLGVAGFFYSLIAFPIFGAIALLVWTAILYFVSQALGGEATFESTFRIVAYTSAISPIAAVLSILPYAPLLANAYALYLTILGVITLNRVEEGKAWKILGGVGAVLLLLSFLGTMAGRRMEPAIERWGSEMEKSSQDLERASEEWRRQMERMAEEMGKNGDHGGD